MFSIIRWSFCFLVHPSNSVRNNNGQSRIFQRQHEFCSFNNNHHNDDINEFSSSHNNRDPIYLLDQFVEKVEKLNTKYQQEKSQSSADIGMVIVSRGSSSSLPTHLKIQVNIFHSLSISQRHFVTVIAQENASVDVDNKLRGIFPGWDLCEVSSDEDLIALCGFPFATTPPVGFTPWEDCTKGTTTIVLDQALLSFCNENNHLLLLGNAGYPLWKSLLSIDFLLHQPDIMVAEVTVSRNHGLCSIQSSVNGERTSPSLRRTVVQPSQLYMNKKMPRPYFPIAGPPTNLAQLVTQETDLSNPLDAASVRAVGRIGSIQTRTRNSMTCSLLPPDRLSPFVPKRRPKLSQDEKALTMGDDYEYPLPWRSAVDNQPMMVELLLSGKIMPSNVDFQSLQEGQLIQIEGRTNVADRSSLQRWVDDRCLDLVVIDCQKLYTDNIQDDPSHQSTDASANCNVPTTLSLVNLSNLTTTTNLVNDVASLTFFEKDLLRQLDCLDKNGSALVGIDCEWQPSQFAMDDHQPQPVLLLQVGFHALHSVHILDFQALLRPLQAKGTKMNDIETQLSVALQLLFRSTPLIKVGYQLTTDLSRMAASYPHISCFQRVDSVLEAGELVKKTLQISRQKKSRYITMSLASMISHYLGMSITKDFQLSDWASRPLSSEQIEYAALDAAVVPVLVEKALDSIDAYTVPGENEDPNESTSSTIPVLERFDGDTRLSKEILSWHFLPLQEGSDQKKIEESRAKNMVGPFWIASSSWVTGQSLPVLVD
ncbi:ribonuclease D [Nitzschia inconspicua]|uniref:Ribonuclease D n=1 Tax=Nitzschia inconspicua TaxID=303405 RepID=A0A9K3LR80_9STRA|nr:ribonuclease D [Nitzschia inconspicua]